MNIGIIGGGAAGMMSAIKAASDGHNVTIIEHNSRVGKKLLATGNGRCNFTNIDMSLKHFHGADISIAENVLRIFDNKKTIEFFNSIGVFPKEKNGCIYPYSEQASAVLDCLRNEIINKKLIEVVTECHPSQITKISAEEVRKDLKNDSENIKLHESQVFQVKTNKKTFYFDKLIIAAGSKASEKTGSDGSGYVLCKSLGHSIRKPLPALCGLRCSETYFKSIAGIRCSAKVSILVDGEEKKNDQGELQITDYGISGIPVFQISYLAARALDKKKNVNVVIDFFPETDGVEDLLRVVYERISNNPDKIMDDLLIGIFHKNLCSLFNKLADISGKELCKNIRNNDIKRLCNLIKNFKVSIVSTNSFENAQVCSGGVRSNEVKETLESKIVQGLYFAGEILDINGDCGGYNLQFAWSSGYVAGCLK